MIGHVTPEAYDGGPIALVQNGDMITIDAKNKTLDLVSSCTHTVTVTQTILYSETCLSDHLNKAVT